MSILRKIFFTVKYSFLLLIIFALFSNSLFSQDTETPLNYEQSGFNLNYNYYGFPLLIEGGYEYRTNSSQVFFPLIGGSFENGLYGVNLFATARMLYRYKRFHFQLSFKQGLIPIGGEYKYENLEHLGDFEIAYAFKNAKISYDLQVGSGNSRNDLHGGLSNTFQVNNFINISSLLYTDAANTLSLDTGISVRTMPDEEQYSYGFSARIPYTFYHYWGEFGIMPFIAYSGYFEDSKKEYLIGTGYLNSLIMGAIAKDTEPYNVLYNFLSYVHVEYKFYLRFLPDAFSSIYLVAYGNIGYGTEYDESFNDGTMLYTVGGGIGFNMFGTVPMQITLGVDRLDNLVINYFISTIIHTF